MKYVIQCSANNVMKPLSPISFLEQAALVHAQRVSIIYHNTKFLWTETLQRCLKIASALSILGVHRGDVVAAVAPNIPALYELHFAVPMSGGVLSALNTKLDTTMLASILKQLEAKVIFVDYEFVEVVHAALKTLSLAQTKLPILIFIPESDQEVSCIENLHDGSLTYSSLLVMGQNDFQVVRPEDETDPISVNYTSGSTGKPKGVIYSHRAAYLNALAAIFRFEIKKFPVFLWTVDMFRCNGWCLPWAMAALGGTNICIRNVTTEVIFDAIDHYRITHLCGAPLILNKIAKVPTNYRRKDDYKVEAVVAGALPPVEILSRVLELGFNIMYGYGMTEALGPVIVNKLCNAELSMSTKSIKFTQGILEEVDVKDSLSMKSIPADGRTIGEVMFRSNAMMSGYLGNLEKTRKAFEDGWYRTGDLGTRLPDGCIQVKDRAVDVIKYRNEIISTLEIEAVLTSHPMVLEAAVVARPDNVNGETPCAFVKLREECDHDVNGDGIIKFCRELLPLHMVPQMVFSDDLPVNSTGKIQKFVLREKTMTMPCNI
ncbi:butanoate--CoA ligase AAE1-like [Apium graveolens]|uniref:butanoate--CoA ligase AAE1-like n=1 Tax=Apium graveolens TaxID=4045 RepID=UPI003D7BEED9